MSTKNEEKFVAIRVEMTKDLRNRFKSVVVREGRNMKDVVVEFIEQYIENREKEQQKLSQSNSAKAKEGVSD